MEAYCEIYFLLPEILGLIVCAMTLLDDGVSEENIECVLRVITCVLFSKCSGSPRDEKDETRDLHSAPEIRDVFGDFDDDEEEEMGYAIQQDIEQDSNVSFWFWCQ